ncbi:cytochrome C assembly family protein [Psychromonas antarctica]|uniref:cytochrome C assembly family protein n=1 Tax=Psychromonas antarctica TaxID=67573 RepID=UPI001EE7F04F|nr:cytochrome c biogenesis protein CcsA [Psychromonas antarctica]MCG6200559.1 cytochrome c biogenesis protein CcsA [Psychromonas antarctica]
MDYFALISSIFYIVAATIATIQLFAPSKSLSHYFFISIASALFCHANWLYQNIFMSHGQNLTILNVLLLVTFIISLLSTVANKRFNTGVLLPIVYGFTVANFIAVSYLPNDYITHLETQPQIATHIILALLAYSILSIASLFAVQLAYLNYRLKNRQLPLTKINMPPLMTLEKSLFQFILIGYILLSGALLTGFIFIEDMFVQGEVHKTILSMIAWVIYGVLLWGHYSKGWRGRLIIYITIVGSSLLTLAYFGSRIVQEIILS